MDDAERRVACSEGSRKLVQLATYQAEVEREEDRLDQRQLYFRSFLIQQGVEV